MINDWRWNDNRFLYENLSLILNSVSTTATSISIPNVFESFSCIFICFCFYIYFYFSFVFKRLFVKLQIQICFVTLLISLFGNQFLFKVFVKFSKWLSKPFHVLLILYHISNRVLMRPILYSEDVKPKKYC